MATNENLDRTADSDEPDDSLAERFRKQNEEADEKDATLDGSSKGTAERRGGPPGRGRASVTGTPGQ